jgi:hypothetical protein
MSQLTSGQYLPLELTPRAEWSLGQSHAAERVGQLNAQGQSTYENAEISLADLRRQLIVGRNWKHILGLADILSSMLDHNAERHYNHMMGMSLVPLTHLKSYMQAVESAYGQGLLPSPMEATTEQITNYFADVITDRELDGATIIEKYERGEIPLTPLEQEAFNLAQTWDSLLRAGQSLPTVATQTQEDYQSVANKWDNPAGTTSTGTTPTISNSAPSITPNSESSPSATPTVSKQAQVSTTLNKTFIPSSNTIKALNRTLLGNIQTPNSTQSTITDISYLIALLGVTYAGIRFLPYVKEKYNEFVRK